MVSIRTLKNNEFDFLTDMLYESIHIPENKPTKKELLNSAHIKKYYEDWGRYGDQALIAIGEKDQPLGAVWYRLFNDLNKSYGYVDAQTPELGIAITKEARGRGIGTLLMKKMIQKAQDEGFKAISLSVDPENNIAFYVYKKLGFYEHGNSGTSVTMLYKITEQ